MLFLKAALVLAVLAAVEGACKETPTTIEQLLLDAHNKYRKLHGGTPDLCYGETGSAVTYTSQTWSESQVTNKKMAHSTGSYGENLYWTSAGSQTQTLAYETAVKLWYEEIKDWDFSKSTGEPAKTGHFTQVVWKDSQEVRCGFAQSSAAGTYVTCQYYKAGNYGGEYAKNVLPLGSGGGTGDTNGDTDSGSAGSGASVNASSYIVVAVCALHFMW